MSRLKPSARALLKAASLAALSTLGLSGAASAEELSVSATVGGTSDYIFRGISQTSENPAAQGSVDLGYGIFYAGVWASNVDFDDAPPANAEVDFYAGIRPTLGPGPLWGPVTFDFGVLYYAYPGADDDAAELDYVELKAGYSMVSPWIKGLTSGTTLYWSDDYGFETGEVFTVESVASYALPQVGIFAPSIGGTWGTVYGDRDEGFTAGGGHKDKYQYWNAGLTLAVEKFSFDFRYWDTDIDVVTPGAGACVNEGLCDERFVFTAKVTLP